jgi:hypothetical protein
MVQVVLWYRNLSDASRLRRSTYTRRRVVFLVHQAEKVDASDKSVLPAAGNERSAALATILRDADIDYVHSTDFIRTRKTASPIAAECGVEKPPLGKRRSSTRPRRAQLRRK